VLAVWALPFRGVGSSACPVSDLKRLKMVASNSTTITSKAALIQRGMLIA